MYFEELKDFDRIFILDIRLANDMSVNVRKRKRMAYRCPYISAQASGDFFELFKDLRNKRGPIL